MLLARWIVLLLLAAGLACLAMYIATGQVRYRLIGLRILKWTIAAGLGFFTVLIIERLADMV